MKKLVFLFVAFAAISFASCGNKAANKATETCEETCAHEHAACNDSTKACCGAEVACDSTAATCCDSTKVAE